MKDLPRLPAETVREINSMASLVDETKFAAAIAHGAPAPEVVQFGPLSERAPEFTSKAIRGAYEAAALKTEEAAQHMLTQIEELMAVSKMLADRTREVGNSQAEIVERGTSMMRDLTREMRAHHAKLDAFKGAAA